MSNRAYIKLVSASKQQSITTEELKEFFHYYKNMTSKTGEQLNWNYENAAFPYEITDSPEGEENWFYLKGKDERYKYIVFGVGEKEKMIEDGEVVNEGYIQVILPDGATHGDKGKANEFCKFLAKQLAGELQLFNGRTMYYYKRA